MLKAENSGNRDYNNSAITFPWTPAEIPAKYVSENVPRMFPRMFPRIRFILSIIEDLLTSRIMYATYPFLSS